MKKLYLACLLLYCVSGCTPKYYVSLRNETLSNLSYIITKEQEPYLVEPNSSGLIGAVYGSDLAVPTLLKVISTRDTLELEYSEIKLIVDSLWLQDKRGLDIVITEEWFSSQLNKKRSKVGVPIND